MISVSRGRCGLRKTEKIFSANNEQGTIKRGEKWFPENFRSESFSIRTYEGRAPASELVLQRGSLPSEIALQGGSLESKMVYRGVGADFKKPKKYFRLIMKKNYLENFKPLYTNKKVQLQLDFLISPAVNGLFY